MAKPVAELYDLDARDDPLFAEYERARDLLQGSEWRQGLEELEKLAHSGSLMSMLLVSDLMRTGWGYDQDLPGAEAWYEVAVESGSARGLYGLGLTHLAMDRFSDAIQDLEAAIARDFPPAYNALAGLYFRGDGVPIDRQRALELWRKGTLLGHLPAKRDLVQQSLQGHYGLWARVEGWLSLLPIAFEMVAARKTHRYSDRMR